MYVRYSPYFEMCLTLLNIFIFFIFYYIDLLSGVFIGWLLKNSEQIDFISHNFIFWNVLFENTTNGFSTPPPKI